MLPAVEWYDWLLFLHVAAATSLVAGVVLLTAILLEVRRGTAGSLLVRASSLAEMLWNVGGITVLIFGIWLAIHGTPENYDFFEGWIIAAIVLWVIASAVGGPLTKAYREARGAPGQPLTVPAERLTLLTAVMAVATLALLVVMIYKPGAG
jgi:uncharacterized membrane protein